MSTSPVTSPVSPPSVSKDTSTSARSGFEFIAKTAVIRSEKHNKGIEAIQATNPNQMNRVIGYLLDGTKVAVAQRMGKGGMDFTKLLGGKVYAVAADGFSPVFEKGEDKKPTKTQKIENGLPLYSASGFYLLSSKEYPALDVLEGYTLLGDAGETLYMLTKQQLAARQVVELESEFDLEMLQYSLAEALADTNNLVSRFDEDMNKKRKRGIDRAREECADSGENYEGVEFKELAVSQKDGAPALICAWKIGDGPAVSHTIARQAGDLNSEGKFIVEWFTPEQALERFAASGEYFELASALNEGIPVQFAYAPGTLMRTSVSFRRKVENVLAADASRPAYGDAVYILAAMKGWVQGIVVVMHSLHPNFPQADYDAHHYVAAPRQEEVGMSKRPDGSGWLPPQAVLYDMARLLGIVS